MKRNDPRHGTHAGAQAHRRDAEPVCKRCREASATYMRALRARNPDDRKRQYARNRAMAALARMHHDDYERLYAAEARKALGQPRLDAELVEAPLTDRERRALRRGLRRAS